jgi:hypothetical protein
MKLQQRIYEAAEQLSVNLVGMPKCYESHPGVYRIDFGPCIYEAIHFKWIDGPVYAARQIWPARQVYTFTRVLEILNEQLIKTGLKA